jgi:hypothetical protein
LFLPTSALVISFSCHRYYLFSCHLVLCYRFHHRRLLFSVAQHLQHPPFLSVWYISHYTLFFARAAYFSLLHFITLIPVYTITFRSVPLLSNLIPPHFFISTFFSQLIYLVILHPMCSNRIFQLFISWFPTLPFTA